ncbi:MAG: protein-disulfide reductase DsbD N-terminal domain-containing protein [Phycisphaerales bacterium]|nr:protein-disulfide reductase DsbD N-terminal domain-containing protein [Phycisphaerales bacterium]
MRWTSSRSLLTGLVLCLLGAVMTARPCLGQPATAGKSFGLPSMASKGGETVSVRVIPSDTVVAPGGTLVLAVVLDQEPGWHVHTHEPRLPASWEKTGFTAYPTAIGVTGPVGVTSGPIQWPEAHTVAIDLTGSGRPEPYEVYEGEAVAFVPVHIPAAAAGAIELHVAVAYQACNDQTCEMPQNEDHTVALSVDATGPVGPTLDAPAFAGFDRGMLAAGPGDEGAGPAPAVGSSRPKFWVSSLCLRREGWGRLWYWAWWGSSAGLCSISRRACCL